MLQAICSGDAARPDPAMPDRADAGKDPAVTPGDFSQQVLSVSTEKLAVLRMGDVGWSDLGTPERAKAALTRHGLWSRGEPVQNENGGDLAKLAAS
jgi:hypothetical protein